MRVVSARGVYLPMCDVGCTRPRRPDWRMGMVISSKDEATRIIWHKLVRCKVFLGYLGSSTQAHHLRYHYKTTDGDARARPLAGCQGWRLARGGACVWTIQFRRFVRGPVRDPTASPPRSFSSWLSVYQRPQSPRACSPCIAFRRCSILKLCSTPASAGWSLPTSCE